MEILSLFPPPPPHPPPTHTHTHTHTHTDRGDATDDYYDPACRRNASLDDHYPALLYNLYSDPRETFQLDPYKYSNVVRKMEMVSHIIL